MIKDHCLLSVLAHAKINLSLHVVGQLANQYHNIESLAAFCSIGDIVSFYADEEFHIDCSGTFEQQMRQIDFNENLITRAWRLMISLAAKKNINYQTIRVHIEKTLPLAAGLGGGSSDAAAVMLGLNKLWGYPFSLKEMQQEALKLGAEMPLMLQRSTSFVTGIGQYITPIDVLPPLPIILINPNQPVNTVQCYQMLEKKDNPPMTPLLTHSNQDEWISYLAHCRNDLTAPAMLQCTEINSILKTLDQIPEVLVSRMSGSGATCFALFQEEKSALDVANHLRDKYPNWWIHTDNLGAPHPV